MRAMVIAALLSASACTPQQMAVREADALPPCASEGYRTVDADYMLFFDQHNATLSSRGTLIIRDFLHRIVDFDSLIIKVIAHKDSSEILPKDRRLDHQRGEAAVRAMRDMGLPADAQVTIVPEGLNDPLVPTPPLTPEPQNRYVRLVFSGGRRVRPTISQAQCMEWLRTHRCDGEIGEAQETVCRMVKFVANQVTSPPR